VVSGLPTIVDRDIKVISAELFLSRTTDRRKK
jgi:hypothetical protein